MKFELTQVFETSPESFWAIFFDEAYNKALFSEGLKVIERTVLALDEQSDEIRRRVRVTPNEQIPAAVQKLIGGDMTYIEDTVWKKGTNEAQVRVEIPAQRLQSKFRFGSTIRTDPVANGLRRTLSGVIEVKIALMGRTIEKHVYEGIERNDAAAAAFMKDWLSNHP
ncbi:MAG: DUF2505 domain-containing protein [Deltaproteobacteria bacterium]|nr:DUF2505 domain-containing protein [Deltaproteobacteria bacterium]